jgi:hypothetical protein
VAPSRTQEWLAGDAVLIAPVSNEIPCKQGILQGISQKSVLVRRPLRRKRLSRSDFPQDSLVDLSGKSLARTGILARLSGKIACAFDVR